MALIFHYHLVVIKALSLSICVMSQEAFSPPNGNKTFHPGKWSLQGQLEPPSDVSIVLAGTLDFYAYLVGAVTIPPTSLSK